MMVNANRRSRLQGGSHNVLHATAGDDQTPPQRPGLLDQAATFILEPEVPAGDTERRRGSQSPIKTR